MRSIPVTSTCAGAKLAPPERSRACRASGWGAVSVRGFKRGDFPFCRARIFFKCDLYFFSLSGQSCREWKIKSRKIMQ